MLDRYLGNLSVFILAEANETVFQYLVARECSVGGVCLTLYGDTEQMEEVRGTATRIYEYGSRECGRTESVAEQIEETIEHRFARVKKYAF